MSGTNSLLTEYDKEMISVISTRRSKSKEHMMVIQLIFTEIACDYCKHFGRSMFKAPEEPDVTSREENYKIAITNLTYWSDYINSIEDQISDPMRRKITTQDRFLLLKKEIAYESLITWDHMLTILNQ
jgi:thioredoxin-related protein